MLRYWQKIMAYLIACLALELKLAALMSSDSLEHGWETVLELVIDLLHIWELLKRHTQI